ncbi:hypothetical protein JCGZ_21738 [Jatropha curcas]|uniref:Uncharacterized protein n=1 Tax=Jatropha curcas TaxID=180498 RepID=A0A067JBW4_JATCU|nr:uncharacterized protein LOC105649812 [Jatropha curcas]KDP21267.1 hypothetical protein JCGZ_21738 [Jatropha curcas]
MEEWNAKAFNQLVLFLVSAALLSLSSINASDQTTNGGSGSRVLLVFKEKPEGSNLTFDCSPSGACVPCQYSEKTDEKYRCSETGYRIPLKCIETKDNIKNGNDKKSQKTRSVIEISNENANPHAMLHDAASNEQRSLLDDSSTLEDGSQAYITYRSCIPPVNEEKLSVLGFEGIILCLFLISGSVVYFRRKQTVTMSGVGGGRIQMNSRF